MFIDASTRRESTERLFVADFWAMAPTIHPSMDRLLEHARLATAGTRRPVRSWSELQGALNVSSAVLTNWKRRGISQAGAIEAEKLFGCAASFILSGAVPATHHTPPPSPPSDFRDDQTQPTVSEWDILDSIRAFPQEERDKIRAELRSRAEYWKRITDEMLSAHQTRKS